MQEADAAPVGASRENTADRNKTRKERSWSSPEINEQRGDTGSSRSKFQGARRKTYKNHLMQKEKWIIHLSAGHPTPDRSSRRRHASLSSGIRPSASGLCYRQGSWIAELPILLLPAAPGSPLRGLPRVIRVDIDKLDKMLDLVGELVIAESMVANNQDLDMLKNDRFGKAVLQLDKISREIQEVAMSMRMIPLAGVFRKMVRLVRDLAQKANKQVDLEIIGEDTEVDKTIIEQISDPLVHLIRNAVDHGLETPAERLAVGKPEVGRVTIEAKHSAGEVWITVEDDGKGLNRDKIFQKGVEKGLVRSEDREMKDDDVWRLIFEPGFSTAEQVSSISGRGVGMDVVKRNIEKLRGKVDVRSKSRGGDDVRRPHPPDPGHHRRDGGEDRGDTATPFPSVRSRNRSAPPASRSPAPPTGWRSSVSAGNCSRS